MTTITHKELRTLEDIWLRKFHTAANSDDGNAQRWFTSVIEFLQQRGDEIISSELRDREHQIIENGLAQEYMSVLALTVASEGARTEYDKAVLILTATPEEREVALKRVYDEHKKT